MLFPTFIILYYRIGVITYRISTAMKDSKLGEYLNALLQEDRKPLRLYLKSYAREGSDLNKLIKHIYKYNKSIEQPQLSTDYIHKKLYPNKSKKTVLNLYSDLLNHIKNYLIQDELKSDEGFQKVFLLKAYNKRLLYRHADNLYRKTSEELKKEKLDFWPALYQQLIDHHYYFSNNPKVSRKKLHLVIQSAIDHAELYHDQIRSLYKYETTTNLSNSKISYEEIRDNYNFLNRLNSSIVKIFQELTNLRMEKSDGSDTSLRLYFIENHTEISETLRIILYLTLKMHNAKKANKGDLSAVMIVFELHKLMADNNYFFNAGQLSPLGFTNIIELSSFLKKHAWAELFIEKYGQHLAIHMRKNVLSLSSAHLHYSRGEYQQSLDILGKTYFKNVNLKSISGRLQLINYIDSEEEDAYFLKQKIENYRLLIYRNQNQLSKRVVKSSFNLVKILHLLVDKKSRMEIQDKMDKMDSIFYRFYLNSKLNKIAQE